MTRCCFIGNSHLAAIKLGWDRVKGRYGGVLVDFFASHIASIGDICRVDTRLVPANDTVRQNFVWTSGGKAAIDLSEYSDVVLVGMGFSLEPLLLAYSQMRSERHQDHAETCTLVSDAVFEEAVLGNLLSSAFCRTSAKIRESGPRIWGIAQPRPSDQVLDADGVTATAAVRTADAKRPAGIGRGLTGRLLRRRDRQQEDETAEFWRSVASRWRQVVANGDDRALAATFARIVERVTGPGFQFLLQPETTLSGHLFTQRRYSAGSVRLSERYDLRHAPEEYRHMNGEFGTIVIAELLSRITQSQARATSADPSP